VGFNNEKSVEILNNPELAGKPFGVRPVYSFGSHRLTADRSNRSAAESLRPRLTRPENMVCGQAWQVYALNIQISRPSLNRSRGFVAKKLCPDLIFVSNHFSRYMEMSNQIMSIFKRYDPTMLPAGCDEGYLKYVLSCSE